MIIVDTVILGFAVVLAIYHVLLFIRNYISFLHDNATYLIIVVQIGATQIDFSVKRFNSKIKYVKRQSEDECIVTKLRRVIRSAP